MRPATRTLPAILALLLLLAACGDDDAGATTTAASGFEDGGGFSESPNTTMAATTTTIPGAPARDEEGGADTDAEQVLALSTLARSIIYTATIEIEVADVTAATGEAMSALAGLGAVIFGQQTTTGDFPSSVITIKVAPEDFDIALDRLAGVGELLSQTITADDVTDRIVDLESRIATAAASVERLRALIEDAPGIEEVILLESELLQRETDLEVLRGQVRTLEDAVALATIVLVLTEPHPESPEPKVEIVQTIGAGHDGGTDCPGRDEIEIDEGEPMTVCFTVSNTGDTGLTEVELTDNGLRLDFDDVIVVEGDLAATFQPGDRLILAYETEAVFGRNVSPEFSAVAVDEDGEPTFVGIEVDLEVVEFNVIEDTSLPGFGDSLAGAWRGMQWLFGVAVLLAGAAVPFLWVPAIAAGVWWWRKRDEQ